MGKETRALKDAYERLRISVVEALADRNLAKVARNVGLHENTIRGIASGKNQKPAIETLERLADYLAGGR
jgi:hypothetical protein